MVFSPSFYEVNKFGNNPLEREANNSPSPTPHPTQMPSVRRFQGSVRKYAQGNFTFYFYILIMVAFEEMQAYCTS
jgi:hypothetical protein